GSGEGKGRTRPPLLQGAKIGRRRRFAAVKDLHCPPAEEGDRESRRTANGLLAGRHNAIKAPFIESKLLATYTTHTIDNNQCLGRDLPYHGSKALEVAKHTGRGIDMSDSKDLVLLIG